MKTSLSSFLISFEPIAETPRALVDLKIMGQFDGTYDVLSRGERPVTFIHATAKEAANTLSVLPQAALLAELKTRREQLSTLIDAMEALGPSLDRID